MASSFRTSYQILGPSLTPASALAAACLAGALLLTSAMGGMASDVAPGAARAMAKQGRPPVAEPSPTRELAPHVSRLTVHKRPFSLARLGADAFADWDAPPAR